MIQYKYLSRHKGSMASLVQVKKRFQQVQAPPPLLHLPVHRFHRMFTVSQLHQVNYALFMNNLPVEYLQKIWRQVFPSYGIVSFVASCGYTISYCQLIQNSGYNNI